jgi:ubiquinone/menaquinone biosynthesis C-methylase UbiE
MRVLDLGCGTGTLTSMIKRSQREAEVIGIDTDPAVLVQARAKAARAGLTIAFDLGSATDLPYLDSSFDRILTCLVLHHLTSDDKQRAFNECFRVLAEDGELHIADLGPPTSLLLRGITLIMGRFEQTADNFAGRLPGMLARAGFVGVETRASFASIFGGLSLLRALRPAEG